MAQVPPKISNISHSMSTYFSTPASTMQHPSWVDEFVDFSSAKRGVHRRSASDSVAFLEAPLEVDDVGGGDMAPSEFDDHYSLLSVFSNEAIVAPAERKPSTPSDHNSNGGKEQKEHHQEIQETEAPNVVDPKRFKRILANRKSAQRSRVRKLQYISELERSVSYLQTEVSALSPRVAYLDHQRSMLTVGNSALRQRIAALTQDKIFKDAHQEELRKEIERLSRVYHQQYLEKMAATGGTPTTELISCTDDQLVGS